MALDVKELCRLCGKKDEFSKDLKDKDNENILKMIQEFIKIPFAEHCELPTKVCLNCEEKIESFQLFIVECYNTQETLRQMYLQTCEKYRIKLEDDIVIDDDFNNSATKSEVKHELSAEDLLNGNNSDECMTMTVFDADDYNNGNDDDNETLDTLKDLKQEKTSEIKRMTLTETGKEPLKEISDLDTGDFSKFTTRGHAAAPRRGGLAAPAPRRHRASRGDEGPFECRQCHKWFKTRRYLKSHEQTHDRRHVCSDCNKAFSRRQTLKVHIMRLHTGDKPLTCEWCDVRYSYPSRLRTHQRRFHRDKMAPHLRVRDT